MRIEHRNSTAYRMCLVAAGDFDAAVRRYARRLGRGRRRPIAREAGCFVGDHNGARSATIARRHRRA
jgi:myo-inositol-1(or 4)-monophosphatase